MYMNNNASINQFYDANEGFKKGNMSKLIYKPYKNYKEKEVVSKNDKEALLLFIQKCDLAIQDLTLYLDIKENDDEVLNFGGLLGYAPISKISKLKPNVLVNRGGQIPSPLNSLKN